MVRTDSGSHPVLLVHLPKSLRICSFLRRKRKYGTCRTMATITVVSPSPPQSLLSGERMTIRLRYRTLKLRALCWALRRLRAGQRRPKVMRVEYQKCP